MKKTSLSVNVNLVAQVRNRRNLPFPSVVRAAEICLQAGAAGITVHPRPDERHIRPHDVADLAMLMKSWPHREFNIEGNPFQNLMGFVHEFKPHQCTFLPDSEDQPTSDHGWDLRRDGGKLRPLIDEARHLGVRVSLFMDAQAQDMALAKTLGADRVELYTEPFAAAWQTWDERQIDQQTRRFAQAAFAATQAGLGINAGHDLNRQNLAAFIRGVPGVHEVSIGHALMSDALELGYAETVKAYLACIEEGSQI